MDIGTRVIAQLAHDCNHKDQVVSRDIVVIIVESLAETDSLSLAIAAIVKPDLKQVVENKSKVDSLVSMGILYCITGNYTLTRFGRYIFKVSEELVKERHLTTDNN